jgi:UDP-N-acetylmuramate--alanine ligase
LRLGIDEGKIRNALMTFLGAKRRCEKKGEVNNIVFYDDYGHHPTEIHATLSAIRKAEPTRRLVAIFQPHRFTRTRDCLHQFASAFQSADLLLLTDIYSAGETPIEGVDIHKVYQEVVALESPPCIYIPKSTLLEDVLREIRSGDLVVSMGAGDITTIGPKVLQELSTNG